MSTRSIISYGGKDPFTPEAVAYCHWDGYPTGVGRSLFKHLRMGVHPTQIVDGRYYSSYPHDVVDLPHVKGEEPKEDTCFTVPYSFRGGDQDWQYHIVTEQKLLIVVKWDWKHDRSNFADLKPSSEGPKDRLHKAPTIHAILPYTGVSKVDWNAVEGSYQQRHTPSHHSLGAEYDIQVLSANEVAVEGFVYSLVETIPVSCVITHDEEKQEALEAEYGDAYFVSHKIVEECYTIVPAPQAQGIREQHLLENELRRMKYVVNSILYLVEQDNLLGE